jgi:cellulose synthase (UDP-forming)
MKIHKQPVITGRNRVFYIAIVGLWLIVNMFFWLWWLKPEHWGAPWLFWLVSFGFFYDGTFLPSVFFYYLGRMQTPVHIPPAAAQDSIERVALITLTVPGSESLDIVRSQLAALRDVEYPHDSWILVDKVHSPDIEQLAAEYGVHYFSRHDVEHWSKEKVGYWNQLIPPFKAKTKAGNVNAWIDAHGAQYSHFTQFDIDHVPTKAYLDRVLGYFVDPKVAWVQAPSVYDNFEDWTARGSTEQEFILQGPLQIGFYGDTDTPFIIGSHATYRMSAIKEIGGFQPTRAEDHLDTLYLSAKGYRGVYVPEIIATGDGPETFETYLGQQFAWAYSLMQVLLFHTPKVIGKLHPKVAFQMLFCETWYPIWSLSMGVLFIAPVLSLVIGQPIANVSFWEYTALSFPVSAVAFLGWGFSRKWHKPGGLFLSWRGIILHMARWSIVLSAIAQAALQVAKPYMITQKGDAKEYSLDPRAFIPFIFLGSLPLLANIWYVVSGQHGPTQGYLLFTLQGAFFMFLVVVVPFIISVNKLGTRALVLQKANTAIVLLGLVSLVSVGTISFPLITPAVMAPRTTSSGDVALDGGIDLAVGLPSSNDGQQWNSRPYMTQLGDAIVPIVGAEPNEGGTVGPTPLIDVWPDERLVAPVNQHKKGKSAAASDIGGSQYEPASGVLIAQPTQRSGIVTPVVPWLDP